MVVICSRNLWYGPKMTAGQRISNEIARDSEKVTRLRRTRQEAKEDVYWVKRGEEWTRSDR